jgi:hypothetical protein
MTDTYPDVHDAGVESFPYHDPADDGPREIARRLRELMRDPELWTALDGDLGGPDFRPGRGAYVLQIVAEELARMLGSDWAGANCLVLSAVRAAADLKKRKAGEEDSYLPILKGRTP